MYLRSTFFYITALGLVCALPTHLDNHNEPSLRIINGEETAVPEAPYYVSIITYDNEVSRKVLEFCGGSILSERYILTAGHCMDGVGYYEVIAGSHLLHGADRVVIPSYKYRIHEQYAPHPLLYNDIATLMLKTPLNFGPRIRPVQLPTWSQANATYVGQYRRIYGRGDVKTSQPGNVYTEELRYLVTDVISNAECRRDFPDVGRGNLCTNGRDGGRRIGACRGDSGGPFMFLDTQIALVSYGEDVCEDGRPTVFTDLGQYLGWIERRSDVIIRN